LHQKKYNQKKKAKKA